MLTANFAAAPSPSSCAPFSVVLRATFEATFVAIFNPVRSARAVAPLIAILSISSCPSLRIATFTAAEATASTASPIPGMNAIAIIVATEMYMTILVCSISVAPCSNCFAKLSHIAMMLFRSLPSPPATSCQYVDIAS